MRTRVLSLLAVVLFAAASSGAHATDLARREAPAVVRVGLERDLGPDFLIESFAPTMRLLRKRFAQTRFETSFFDADDLARAVRERRVDLFFSNSALFGLLQLESGAMQIAARTPPFANDPSRASSFAVVVRRGSTIRRLEDLPGKRIAAERAENFSTWLLFRGVLKHAGVLADGWDANVRFTGFEQPDPIQLVQQAAADAAVVPACRLESLIDMNVVGRSELVVLNEQPREDFPCRRSTELFPDIVLGVTSGVESVFASALSVAVLGAPPFRMGERWRMATDFTTSTQLFKQLAVGPYQAPAEPTLKVFWQRYRNWIAGVIGALLLLALHSVFAERLVERRTRALRQAIEEKELAANEARAAHERMARFERSSVVSGLSSMFAHEVRQPLAAVVAYADGIRLASKQLESSSDGRTRRRIVEAAEALVREAGRVSDIVERVRSYAKSGPRPHERIDLRRLVEQAAKVFRQSSISSGVSLELRLAERVAVEGEPLELELAVVNLMRNGASAMSDREPAERRLTVELRRASSSEAKQGAQGFAVLTVADEGARSGPVAPEVFRQLAEPVTSPKSEGLGLGLFIVRRIAEAHGGSLGFRRRPAPSHGLEAELRLPLAENGVGAVCGAQEEREP